MASKRRIRRKSCDGKKRYNSYEEAEQVFFSLKNKGKLDDKFVAAYKCKFCGGFHWGHATAQQMKNTINRYNNKKKA